MKRGAKASSWSGEYVAAIVVHARDRKTRLSDVDHDDSMGIAKSDANGTVNGASRDVRDIAVVVICCFR